MTRNPPSFPAAVAAVARFAMLRHFRSRRTIIAIVTTLVLVAAVAASRFAGEQSTTEAWTTALAEGLLGFVAYVLPFLFHASSMSEEHEDRTLTYLITRPVSRAAIVLGKYVGGAAIVVSIALVTTLVLHVTSFAGSFETASARELARASLAVTLLCLGHGAIATLWSTVTPEQATPMTVVHFVVGELGPRYMPSVLRLASMHHHASEIAGLPRPGLSAESTPTLPLAASAGAIVLLAAFFVFVAILIASAREYRFAKA